VRAYLSLSETYHFLIFLGVRAYLSLSETYLSLLEELNRPLNP